LSFSEYHSSHTYTHTLDQRTGRPRIILKLRELLPDSPGTVAVRGDSGGDQSLYPPK